MDTLAGASVDLNGVVLLFAAGVVVLSAVCLWTHSRHPLDERGRAVGVEGGRQDDRRERGTESLARRAGWLRKSSLALILLVGAGLMMKSLYRLLSVDPGFQPDRVLTMGMSLRTAQYEKDAAIMNFWQQVSGPRPRRCPAWRPRRWAPAVPLTDDHWRTDITVEGMALPKPGSFPHPDVHIVSPGYVSTLGIRLLRGRDIHRRGHRECAARGDD